MLISLERKSKYGQFIKINSKEQNTNIYVADLVPSQFAETGDIEVLINAREQRNLHGSGGGMVIASPGEFEKDGVFVWAQINNLEGEEKAIDLVELEAEGVRVLYSSSTTEVRRDLLNDMGVIDVMVLFVQPEFQKQVKSVSAVDPQILIPVFAEGVDQERFKKEVGAKFESESKYKCKAIDFMNEEYVLQGVVLENN